MTRPTAIQILLTEHGELRRLLSAMEMVLVPPDVAAIGRLMDNLTPLLSRHARKEEEVFLPGLRERGALTLGGLMDTLSEHGKEELILAEVEVRVAPAARSPSAAQVLAEACRRMIDDLREHLRHEERFIFPGAVKMLGTEQLRELGDRMEALHAAADQKLGLE